MKWIFVALWVGLLVRMPAAGQEKILRGSVVDGISGEPLPAASVYINNTTHGTLTDAEGVFRLKLFPGRHEIVVSMVGYDPLVYPLEVRAEDELKKVLFRMSATTLAEVAVKAKRDPEWYRNLEVFKENFLGRSNLGRQCKLLNPEVLTIVFDAADRLLEVTTAEPLQIENPALGYRIHYNLIEFRYDMKAQYVSYLGYPRYEQRKAGRGRRKRQEKKRLEAYHGSFMHFVRALRAEALEKEGFNLRRLHRFSNPDRPDEAELEEARRKSRELGGGSSLPANHPVSITLSRSSLPKIIEKLDTARVPYNEYVQRQGGESRLGFEGYFQVVYTGEKEEPAYAAGQGMLQPRKPGFQTSVFSLKNGPVILEKSGTTSDPLSLLFEGYWGWEKMGNLLPLDYEPGISR